MRSLRKMPKNRVKSTNIASRVVSICRNLCYNIRKNIKNKGADKVSERKDFLNGKIQALQDERAAYAGDQAEQIRINGTLATFQKELDEILATEVKTQEDEQAKAERIEVAKGEATSLLLTDEAFKDMPPSVITFVEIAVELALTTEQQTNAAEKVEMVKKYEDKIRILVNQGAETEDQFAIAREENENMLLELSGAEALELQLKERIRQLQELRSEDHQTIAQLTLEREEALKVRDNAAEQLRLAEIENKRLNDEISEMQAAKVFGEKEAQKIINVQSTDSLKAAADRIMKEYKVIAELGLYKEIADAEGNKEVVRNTELANLVIVESFEGPTFQEVNLEDFRAETVDETQSGSEQGNVADAGQAEGNAETQQERRVNSVSREEFDELKADVEALKRGSMAA